MQSASDTPSSHLREPSCHADQRGVWCGGGRRAYPGTKGCREREGVGATWSPPTHPERRDTPLESGSGAVAVAPAYLFPPLSSGGLGQKPLHRSLQAVVGPRRLASANG